MIRFGFRVPLEIEKRIGYRFRDRGLLSLALMHPSYRSEHPGEDKDNQRLEFLGDAVLGMLTAVYLYREYPQLKEGGLTALRTQLASGKALSEIGAMLQLGEHLQVGRGEEITGGRGRPRMLADTLEALLGAVYLDGGLKAAEKLFEKFFMPRIQSKTVDVWEGNPKGQLQEYSQRKWKKGPRYRVSDEEGPAHARMFTVVVELPDGHKASGRAGNRRDAESRAADSVLRQLESHRPA